MRSRLWANLCKIELNLTEMSAMKHRTGAFNLYKESDLFSYALEQCGPATLMKTRISMRVKVMDISIGFREHALDFLSFTERFIKPLILCNLLGDLVISVQILFESLGELIGYLVLRTAKSRVSQDVGPGIWSSV
jgi:hypothetical protein